MLAIGINNLAPQTAKIWYTPYIENIASKNAVPDSIASWKSFVNRREVAEMLWRLKEGKTTLASTSSDSLLASKCTWFTEQTIPGVDMEEAKRAWLSWVNGVRVSMKLTPYYYDKQLTRTAYAWSVQAATTGTISHKRPGQTVYYDYPRMVDWFQSKGITFANVDRQTFTENIGWGVFKCKSGDCTKKFIDSMRTTFDFYMSEKGKANAPHYRTIVDPEFRELGLGLSVSGGKYFLTAHYGTSITSNPEPLCP